MKYHIKVCSKSLVIREVQIKTTIRYHHTSTRMPMMKKKQTITKIGKDVEKLEPSYFAGGNVKWYSRCVNQFGVS